MLNVVNIKISEYLLEFKLLMYFMLLKKRVVFF